VDLLYNWLYDKSAQQIEVMEFELKWAINRAISVFHVTAVGAYRSVLLQELRESTTTISRSEYSDGLDV